MLLCGAAFALPASPEPSVASLQADLQALQARADAASIGGGASLTESIDTVKDLLKDGASLAACRVSVLPAS